MKDLKSSSLPFIVLASGSPRRRELLTSLGWPFTVVVSNVEERLVEGESAREMARRLAELKAGDIAESCPDALVIAADTIVTIDDRILCKPSDEVEAMKMLAILSGRKHFVITGLSLFRNGRVLTEDESTEVRFRSLSAAAVRAYAATGEGLDKAGAYAIQGKGALLVESICGDYFNVVGLPLCRLSKMVERMGIDLSAQWGCL